MPHWCIKLGCCACFGHGLATQGNDARHVATLYCSYIVHLACAPCCWLQMPVPALSSALWMLQQPAPGKPHGDMHAGQGHPCGLSCHSPAGLLFMQSASDACAWAEQCSVYAATASAWQARIFIHVHTLRQNHVGSLSMQLDSNAYLWTESVVCDATASAWMAGPGCSHCGRKQHRKRVQLCANCGGPTVRPCGR